MTEPTSTRVLRIIDYVEARLTPLMGIAEDETEKLLTVYVDRSEPVPREECPAVNVLANMEDATAYGAADIRGREQMRNVFRLELHIVTRGDPPVRMCERNFFVIHKRLMADRTLGGLVHRIRYANRRWQKASADQSAGWLVVAYDVIYTANDTDLA